MSPSRSLYHRSIKTAKLINSVLYSFHDELWLFLLILEMYIPSVFPGWIVTSNLELLVYICLEMDEHISHELFLVSVGVLVYSTVLLRCKTLFVMFSLLLDWKRGSLTWLSKRWTVYLAS